MSVSRSDGSILRLEQAIQRQALEGFQQHPANPDGRHLVDMIAEQSQWLFGMEQTHESVLPEREQEIFGRGCNIPASAANGLREWTIGMSDRETEWAALLLAANAGDGVAYARFLQAAAPVLRGIVRARGRGLAADDHEDIVQEVLIAIHARRQTWMPGAPLLPWLYAITRYKVADAFRRRGGRIHLPIEDMAELLEAEPAGDPTARRDSDRLIGHLDPRAAQIVRAVSLEGETMGVVGDRLGMTEGAVRVALHRALKRMAQIARGAER